jgi:Ca2+-binding RTX toxin-like protein
LPPLAGGNTNGMSLPRIARLVVATACLLLIAGVATAHAGVVTREGAGLVFTSSPGQADRLKVRQGTATTILFDDVNLPITTTAAGCQVISNNVYCSNVVWTAVRADLRDEGDLVIASFDDGTSLGVPLQANGGAGEDALIGGVAGDALDPGADGGSAEGRAGNDTLRQSTDDRSSLQGGAGTDTLDARAYTGQVEFAYMNGGDGNDTMRTGSGRAVMFGDLGDDQLVGGAGNDVLDGGPGRDDLAGGAGDDELRGGSIQTGNAFTSDGQDTIAGGAGLDLLSYAQRTTAVTVDLSTPGGDGEAGENDATSTDIENIRGGWGSDTLLGDGQSNDISGGAGADTIDGRGGYDQVRGNADADTIIASGDDVDDFVVCGSTFTTYQPPLAEGSDAVTANVDHLDLIAQQGDCETIDRLAPPTLPQQAGTSRSETLRGTRAADELLGRGGNDIIFGFGGNDRSRGGGGNDRLYGGAGRDDIDGDFGNDRLFGQAGADSLDGGRGADQLLGGPGADSLVGGPGVDRLNGGSGRDFLLARDGSRRDVITCTRTASTPRARRQRDVVVADRGDVIRNRKFCARVTFT